MNNNIFLVVEEIAEINRLKEEIKKSKNDLKIFKESLKIDISNIIYYSSKNYKDLNNEEKSELDFSIGGFQALPLMITELELNILSLKSALFLIEKRNIDQYVRIIEQNIV